MQTAIASLRSWVVAGSSGLLPSDGLATPHGATPAAGEILVIRQDRGHVWPYRYAKSTYEKRGYEFSVSVAGYVALCVVDQTGGAVAG